VVRQRGNLAALVTPASTYKVTALPRKPGLKDEIKRFLETLAALAAVIRITEYPYLAVEVLVLHLFKPGQDLAKILEAPDVCYKPL
jgi:hypothetical protein